MIFNDSTMRSSITVPKAGAIMGKVIQRNRIQSDLVSSRADS